MTINRDDFLPDAGRSSAPDKKQAHYPIERAPSDYTSDLYAVSDLLVCMNRLVTDLSDSDDIEFIMPRAIECLSSCLFFHTLTVIEAYKHNKNLCIWFDSHTPLAVIRETLSDARDNYRIYVDSSGDFRNDHSQPHLIGGTFTGIVPQFEPAVQNRILLPLAVGNRDVFGLMQIDTTEASVQDDERLMAILNFFAKRVATSIERSSIIHYQRKLLAQQYSANAKLTELEQQRLEAIAANAAKSSFLANMSHEIRTPLGIILGFSELLGTGEIAPAERDVFQNTIQKNGQLLAKIVDDILDLSKIEEGKIELEYKTLSLNELLHDMETTFFTRAREKGLAFHIIRDPNTPESIISDPFRLRQILINLVNNALKFTEEGSVTIRVQQGIPSQPISHSTDRLLQFEIIDTGVGINHEEVCRLFQPFSQASSSTARKYGGTGLGLVLARRLANALGGDVVLRESEPNAGSTFVLTIEHSCKTSIHAVTSHEAPQESTISTWTELKGSRILIADDALDNLLLFSTVLRAHGAFVDTAVDGFEAVEKALQNTYDIVLLDLQMPVKDGFAAANELRRRGFTKPILALTAMAMAEERTKAIEAGCDDHLSKPVKAEQLVQKIVEMSGTHLDTRLMQ
ncbi:MAG: ATP-binding protein [Bdellovibrionota bacterium]